MKRRECKGPCGRDLELNAENFGWHSKGNGHRTLRHVCRRCIQDKDNRRPSVHDPSVTDITGCLQWATSLERQIIEAFAASGTIAGDVLHAKWGRVNRHTVGIRQVWHRLGVTDAIHDSRKTKPHG